MTEKQKQAVKEMLTYPIEKRREFADKQLWKIMVGMRNMGYTVAKINETIFGVTRLFVSADLDCQKYEYDFFCSMTGEKYDKDYFFKATNHGRTEEFLKTCVNWYGSLTSELQTDILTFWTYMFLEMGYVNDDEDKLINLLNQYRK